MKIKKFRVPSKSEPNKYRIVEVLPTGKIICDCMAGSFNKPCRHKKVILKELIRQGIKRIYEK